MYITAAMANRLKQHAATSKKSTVGFSSGEAVGETEQWDFVVRDDQGAVRDQSWCRKTRSFAFTFPR